jgi:hypothetical protein
MIYILDKNEKGELIYTEISPDLDWKALVIEHICDFGVDLSEKGKTKLNNLLEGTFKEGIDIHICKWLPKDFFQTGKKGFYT